MLHPDYQYTPQLIAAMAALIASGRLRRRARLAHPRRRRARGRHAALQVRREPRRSPLCENLADRQQALRVPHRLSRVLARACSRRCRSHANSDDFVFDNQMLVQAHLLRLPDRRDHLPDEVLRGGLVHQFPPKACATESCAAPPRCSTGCIAWGVSCRRCSSAMVPLLSKMARSCDP